MSNPLGRYANIGALIASLFVLAVNVLVHAAAAVTGIVNTDPFLDNITILAFGVLIGQVGAHGEAVMVASQKVNGWHAEIVAANARLDRIGAPAAAAEEPDPPVI